MIRPRRSVLYIPGSNARALEKAATLGADALILDLEDAVAPDAKETARQAVIAALHKGFGHRETVVRINALDSPWGEADLRAAAAAKPDAVLIPKTESARDIHRAEEILFSPSGADTVALWAMIETPRAVLDAAPIASAGGRLACLVAGTNDLVKEMGAQHIADRSNVAAALTFTVLAARANRLGVIDGVFNDIADAEGFVRSCAQGRAFGFDGKTVIHPSQIEPANAAFAPSADEIATARRLIAAFEAPENRGRGAILFDGKMAELLHRDIAINTVALADAIKVRGA